MIHPKDLSALVQVGNIYASMSTAERAKVGAVIFNEVTRNIISVGYNGTPPGEDNTCEIDGVTKDNVIHAEINALNKLDGVGIWRASEYPDHEPPITIGLTMYVTLSPCMNCAQAIIEAKIKKVICFEMYMGRSSGFSMLQDAGVGIEKIFDPMKDGNYSTIRF